MTHSFLAYLYTLFLVHIALSSAFFPKESAVPIVPYRTHKRFSIAEVDKVQFALPHQRPHTYLLYGAYGWLLLSGILHFGIDVVSQYIRGKRIAGTETTLYYGLNSSYALGQVLFAILALFAIQRGLAAIGQWPGLALGLIAACAWMVICFRFLEYSQPRIVLVVFALLLVGAAFTS